MSKIKENSFDGAPGGSNGTLNYSTGYGTFASPDASQTPAAFQTQISNHSNTAKDVPLTGSISKDIDKLYSKKNVPTPDDVIAGIKYELGRQIKPDKAQAKQIVLNNLKKNPHYYADLDQLNIDDKRMTASISENKEINVNIPEVKKIFASLGSNTRDKYVVNPEICDIMKELWDKKHKKNSK